MFKRILFILLLLLFQSPAIRCIAQEENAAGAGPGKEYIIAANDVLQVSVYGEADLSVTLRVSQNGTVSYPLLGNIKAAGRSVRQLEQEIIDLLGRDYLVNPQVSIFVKEYAKISILGQVKNAGSYEMRENLTLTQAIAVAGGFSDTANTNIVKIIRASSDKKETIMVNIGSVLNKTSTDVELKSGDTIIVEEAGRISLMGQVARPGVYSLKAGLSVVELIAQAGGFTAVAAQDGTRVIRIQDGKKKVINVPVGSILKGGDKSRDIILEANDTIVVPESFF